MPIPVRFVPPPLPASLEGLLLCREDRARTLFAPVSSYVVLYVQEELCLLTCPRCALPYWEALAEEAVVYERSGEGKPAGHSKALYRTGRRPCYM